MAGSEAALQLPSIDFCNINKQNRGSLVWDSTKTQVFKALQEYGCFEATFNYISPHLRESVFASMKQLFDLPLETKLKNTLAIPFYGYLGQSSDIPLYESLGMDDPQTFTNLMWPQGNHEFCKSMQNYIEEISKLDEFVRMMVLESLNLEKYLEEHMELTKYLIRVMKYRVPDKNESDVGLRGHADKNILTILHQNEAGGLEMQNKDGEWIRAKVSANCFLVLAGESLHAWTNGRLHAAVHRVTMKGDKTRFSIGLFSVGQSGYFVKAPKELVDDEYPLLFKPFDYEEFLKFFVLEENIDNKLALRKYCGICN